jgi:FkbM family methyltransferase
MLLLNGRLLYVMESIWLEPSNRGQRFRRILMFFGWQFWKRAVGTPIKARLCNGLLTQVWQDCDVTPSALYYSLPNSSALAFLREHLDGGTFVDVGANVGLVSLLVADKVKHAILFEPNPRLVERARENLRINGLKFDIVAAALSDQSGSIEFENATTDASCNRIVDGFTTSKATISVPRTTFDQFVRELRSEVPPISGVKIDVEGHENSVLRGMRSFLREHRPKLVMFEYLARTDIAQTLALFREAGYAVFEITHAGPRIATEMVAPLQDLFACPDELSGDSGAVGRQ